MGSPTLNFKITAQNLGGPAFREAEGQIRRLNAATQESAEGFNKAKASAELFGHSAGVGVGRELQKLIAGSKVLGPLMEAAFPIAAAVAFGEVIADVADKFSKWIADTFIFTDAMKEANKVLVEQNQEIEKFAARQQKAEQEFQLVGLTGSQLDVAKLRQNSDEVEKLRKEEFRLRDEMYMLRRENQQGSDEYTKLAGQLGVVQSHMRALQAESATLGKQTLADVFKEGEEAAKKFAEAMEKVKKEFKEMVDDAKKGLGTRFVSDFSKGVIPGAGIGEVFGNEPFGASPLGQGQLAIGEKFPTVPLDAITEKTLAYLKKLEDQGKAVRQVWIDAGKSIGEALQQGILMGRDWSDILKAVILDVIKLTIQLTVMENITKMSKSGGLTGFFGSFLIGLAGGKAMGGDVSAGMTYVVGEKGPELFVPHSAGTIVPNGAGIGSVVYNIDARGADAGVEQRIQRALRESEKRTLTRSVSMNREMQLRSA